MEQTINKRVAQALDARFNQQWQRAGALTPVLLSLAACGGTSKTETDTNPVVETAVEDTPATASADVYIYTPKTQNAGLDSTDLINYSQIVVRQANGDVALTDLQSTTSDAASGTPGTTYRLEDVGQQTAGTITLNYDAQAVDEPDTVVDLYLDEVAGRVGISGGDVETLNIILDEATAAESSALDSLTVQGLTDLNISGGGAGHSFTVSETIPVSVVSLDAGSAQSDLRFDLAQASSQQVGQFVFGSGDDRIVLGDGFGSDDQVVGGDGIDRISFEFSTATIRAGTLSGVETVDSVFFAPATFDASNTTGLQTINLGLNQDLQSTASTADADFNDLKSETQTLNIYASQQDVELDYQRDADAILMVNLLNDTTPMSLGDANAGVGSRDLTFIEVSDLSIAHQGAASAEVLGTVHLSDDAHSLQLSTENQLGDVRIGAQSTTAAITGSSALQQIEISAVEGNIDLYAGATVTGAAAILDVPDLQSYSVRTDSADLNIGTIGQGDPASELEMLSFTTVNGGSLVQEAIDASGADIAVLRVKTSDNNFIQTFGPTNPPANIQLSGLTADSVARLGFDLSAGGTAYLINQNYELNSLTLVGSGNFGLAGGDIGLVQTQPGAAGTHSGQRVFGDGGVMTFCVERMRKTPSTSLTQTAMMPISMQAEMIRSP
jgi:hypothetical protein